MRRVVFVDDNADFLDLIEQELQDDRFQIVTVLDKKDRDLCGTIVAERPDLLLIDVYLSSIDCKELCSLLRADAGTSKVPLYLISFSEKADTTKIAAAVNASGSFSKPLSTIQIIELLKRHFPSDWPTS